MCQGVGILFSYCAGLQPGDVCVLQIWAIILYFSFNIFHLSFLGVPIYCITSLLDWSYVVILETELVLIFERLFDLDV